MRSCITQLTNMYANKSLLEQSHSSVETCWYRGGSSRVEMKGRICNRKYQRPCLGNSNCQRISKDTRRVCIQSLPRDPHHITPILPNLDNSDLLILLQSRLNLCRHFPDHIDSNTDNLHELFHAQRCSSSFAQYAKFSLCVQGEGEGSGRD